MSTQTKIVIGIIILGAGLIGTYLLFFNTSSTSAISSSSAPASAAEVTFLDLATKTGPITFDTAILTDPRFTSLINTETTVIPVPQGRRDPFAPVPGITGN